MTPIHKKQSIAFVKNISKEAKTKKQGEKRRPEIDEVKVSDYSSIKLGC